MACIKSSALAKLAAAKVFWNRLACGGTCVTADAEDNQGIEASRVGGGGVGLRQLMWILLEYGHQA